MTTLDCVVLGTGGMMPTPLRMTASVLVRREGRMLLFDGGEGIQISIKRGSLGIAALDAIAVSHLHADHVLGLPGVMMFRAQCSDPTPLTVIGPPGIEQFLRHTIEDLHYYINYELRFIETRGDAAHPVWSWNGTDLCAEPLEHSTFCLGYRLQEPARPGRFDVDRARALGIPPGPLYGRLQAGESVTLPDGRVVQPADVLGPPRRGRVVTFATDTQPCAALERLCAGADIAFIEGMYTRENATEALEKRHMTAADAAAAAARAGAARAVLLHISPRYSKEDERILQQEAQASFAHAEIARELEAYPVPLVD